MNGCVRVVHDIGIQMTKIRRKTFFRREVERAERESGMIGIKTKERGPKTIHFVILSDYKLSFSAKWASGCFSELI